ncbi:spc3-signal peptidase subunit [Malassezia pachydermatis]|uniref:Signal peptidase subunit 3 n=1 Tax=Malassezia pachydermatis TaxID=77020 RepID=A0A0M9VQJ5_9BASI|nr:spc3-signal peptidase subunit [Malassezia pachydermatis]KOS15613.1 spc3-signal peptidase subunit [Malassezia pachydermatis]
MYSLYQRANLISAFALSVLSVVLALVALTGLQVERPVFSIDVKDVDIVYGRARYHADRRIQSYLETTFDLDMDLEPLFNWNTKQVFLSLTASYKSPKRGTNDVVIWDKIVRPTDQTSMILHDVHHKYGLREYTKSFANITSMDFRLEYNVMPYVGFLQRGVTLRSAPITFEESPTLKSSKVKLMPY